MQEEEIIDLFCFSSTKNIIGNDTAFIKTPLLNTESYHIYATDSMVEGSHFNLKWSSPRNLAKKLIASNNSDFLASGAQATYALLNLGLNFQKINKNWLVHFSQALNYHLDKRNIQLIGGDTFQSKQIFLNMTMVGESVNPISRNKLRIDDYLYITGKVGFSYLGFTILNYVFGKNSNHQKNILKSIFPSLLRKPKNFKSEVQRFLVKQKNVWDRRDKNSPIPRISPFNREKKKSNDPLFIQGKDIFQTEKKILFQSLYHHLAPGETLFFNRTTCNNFFPFRSISSGIDISDGLLEDLRKLSIASNACLDIRLDYLFNNFISWAPEKAALFCILNSGEEYKIVFGANIPPEKISPTLPILYIGKVAKGDGVRYTFKGNEIIGKSWKDSYSHF
jgi:thiamine monophosphate kinase